MHEELGINSLPKRCIWESTSPWGVELSWWSTEIDVHEAVQINPEEVAWYRWMSHERMEASADLLASNAEFFRALKIGTIKL